MFCPLGVKMKFVTILSNVVLWYNQIVATGVACAQLWYFVRTVWFARSHTYILCKNKRWNVLHYLYDFYGQIIFSSSFCSQSPSSFFLYVQYWPDPAFRIREAATAVRWVLSMIYTHPLGAIRIPKELHTSLRATHIPNELHIYRRATHIPTSYTHP